MIINPSVEVSSSEKEVEERTLSRDSETGTREEDVYIYISNWLKGAKVQNDKGLDGEMKKEGR